MKLTNWILLIALGLGLAPAVSAWGAEGCMTATCHPKIQLSPSGIHAQCTDCHESHAGTTPKPMGPDSGKLCLECHSEVAAGPNLHGPVKAGGCRFCHQIHGSDQPSLLKAQGAKVCFPCHGGIAQTIKQAKSQHSPVVDGVCWDCHTPHGSKLRPLLKGAYPKAFYTGYREDRFELCFSCHDKNGIEYDLTSEATGFRNGTKNLHTVHVNRPTKGRVCKTCHAVHGGDQEKLIWRFTPEFGAWDIPLHFKKTDTGGTCFVGCHNPKAYDRFRVIVNP